MISCKKLQTFSPKNLLKKVTLNIFAFINSQKYISFKDFHARNHRDVVRLHVTLMKTSNRSRPKNMNYAPKIPFNATKILKKYQDFYFGTVFVNEIHLSEMGTESCNGYYESISIIKL